MSVDKFERGDLQILTTFVDQDIWNKVRQLMVFARDVAAHLIPSAGRQATPLPYPGAWTPNTDTLGLDILLRPQTRVVLGLGVFRRVRIERPRGSFCQNLYRLSFF
jgi:hypothetical protein